MFTQDDAEGMRVRRPVSRISKPQSVICGIQMKPHPEMRKKSLYSV